MLIYVLFVEQSLGCGGQLLASASVKHAVFAQLLLLVPLTGNETTPTFERFEIGVIKRLACKFACLYVCDFLFFN